MLIPSEKMIADTLTKPSHTKLLNCLKEKFFLIQYSSSSRGCWNSMLLQTQSCESSTKYLSNLIGKPNLMIFTSPLDSLTSFSCSLPLFPSLINLYIPCSAPSQNKLFDFAQSTPSLPSSPFGLTWSLPSIPPPLFDHSQSTPSFFHHPSFFHFPWPCSINPFLLPSSILLPFFLDLAQ